MLQRVGGLIVIPLEEGVGRSLKKDYKSPQLTVYGPVVSLTQTGGRRGKVDNRRATRNT
jgi:hypothetical protein